jgi:hypothetical protein
MVAGGLNADLLLADLFRELVPLHAKSDKLAVSQLITDSNVHDGCHSSFD